MAKSEAQMIEEISQRWGASVDVSSCTKIVHFVFTAHKNQLSRLTFLDFSRITGRKPDDDRLLQAISLLSSHYALLDMHLVYFDSYGMSHDLSDDDMRFFFETGKVVDKEKGELIESPRESVFPYFSALKFSESAARGS